MALAWLDFSSYGHYFMPYFACAIIIKGEVFDQILPYYFCLIIALNRIGAFYYIILLTTSIVFSKMTFFAVFYTCAVFKLLLLLRSLLKRLFLLRFLVWPLLPILLVLLSLEFLIFRLALIFPL